MGSLDNDINQDFQDAIDVMQRHSDIFYYEAENKYYETLRCQESSVQLTASCYHYPSHSGAPGVMYDWRETSSWPHDVPETSPWPVVEAPTLFPLLTERLRKGEERLSVGLPEIGCDTNHSPYSLQSKSLWFRKPFHRNGRKKLRLYEYLHEALHNAGMADSIQWTDRGSGTFHFISKNKEKLAECWGQRKGNRKAMTYQKMARALRNYSRTGEIVKVRRKLTYQFNPLILQRLEAMATASSGPSVQELLPPQQIPAEQGFYCPALPDWHSWYGQHPYQGECDPTTVLTSHDVLKTQASSQRE